MKKSLVLILSLMLLSISSFAQLQKGNLLLGGNVNFQTSSTESDNLGVAGGNTAKSNSFSISPLVGYFLSDRTVLGLKVDYFSSKTENLIFSGPPAVFENDRIGLGPFVRRYFPVKEWVAFYGQAEMNYGSSKYFQTNNSNSSSETKIRSVNFAASLGLSFFPTKWMSIDVSAHPLSFSSQKNQNTSGGASGSETTTNGFNLNLNSNSLSLGAHFFLNKK
jgi:hypothetical protein